MLTTENNLKIRTKDEKGNLLNLQDFVNQPGMQAKIEDVTKKNASAFATTLISITRDNELLRKATPASIVGAALMSASLGFSIGLDEAYIVPYKNNKTGTVEAQFQIGYQGNVQLALRSGLFKLINVCSVTEGQLKSNNPLMGPEFDFTVDEDQLGKVIGYAGIYILHNGYSRVIYKSAKSIEDHAKKYSKSFNNAYGQWKTNFDAMATKTVYNMLLKLAPKSVDMQKAYNSDQSVLNENMDPEYVDNDFSDVTVVDTDKTKDIAAGILKKTAKDKAKSEAKKEEKVVEDVPEVVEEPIEELEETSPEEESTFDASNNTELVEEPIIQETIEDVKFKVSEPGERSDDEKKKIFLELREKKIGMSSKIRAIVDLSYLGEDADMDDILSDASTEDINTLLNYEEVK